MYDNYIAIICKIPHNYRILTFGHGHAGLMIVYIISEFHNVIIIIKQLYMYYKND